MRCKNWYTKDNFLLSITNNIIEKEKLCHEIGVGSRHLSDQSRHLCLLLSLTHTSTILYIYTFHFSTKLHQS